VAGATGTSPEANALVFSTNGDGKPGVANSGKQKAVTLNFTEFVFTRGSAPAPATPLENEPDTPASRLQEQPAKGSQGGTTTGSQTSTQKQKVKPPPVVRDETWKNKWVFLGGSLGVGGWSYSESRYDYNNDHFYTSGSYYDDYNDHLYNLDHSGPVFGGGFIADLSLFKFFSIEANLMLVYDSSVNGGLGFAAPVMAKLGGRFGEVELTANAGYTLGMGSLFGMDAGLGVTFGGTFGVHAGPGVIFAEVFALPFNANSPVLGTLGYKVGVGDKK
jgi:hypothetical protein